MRFKKVLGEKLDGVEGFGKRVREKGLGMGDGVEGFEKRFGRRVWEWGMGWKGNRKFGSVAICWPKLCST